MVNIALIGLGQRGQATLNRLGAVADANIVLTCDRDRDWHEAVTHPSVDLVWICTPWEWHVPMAVAAMRAGKDVALEVPASMTLSDCQQLVDVSAETGRHCIMLENCCYDTWHLGVREIVKSGMLGRIKHLEGAYSHFVPEGWMRAQGRRNEGNPYPTHALGPMCQLLPEGDRPDYLVSLSSPVPGDHTNTSLIRSLAGVSMLLHYDISTPRPYSRMQTVCGTLGFLQKYPLPTVVVEGREERINLSGDEAVAYVERFIPHCFRQMIAEGKALGVANVMNYMMDRRLIEAMELILKARREGRAEPLCLDMDVREAALWSSSIELTNRSVRQGSAVVMFPKF